MTVLPSHFLSHSLIVNILAIPFSATDSSEQFPLIVQSEAVKLLYYSFQILPTFSYIKQ